MYVNKISNIRIILLSDRFAQAPHGRKILLSVDGVDCPFHEPCRPVYPGYNSHKLKRAGLRYEIAVALYSHSLRFAGWVVDSHVEQTQIYKLRASRADYWVGYRRMKRHLQTMGMTEKINFLHQSERVD